jgi:hypothetical protein
MWAHVHLLKVRERAGAQRREMPAVPGADRGGGPSVRGVVNYTTGGISDGNRSFAAGRLSRKMGKKKERKNIALPLDLTAAAFTFLLLLSVPFVTLTSLCIDP